MEAALEASRALKDRAYEGAHLCLLGLAHAELGAPRRAIGLYEKQLEIVREIGDRHGEARALYSMSLALYQPGQQRQVITCMEAALEIFEQIESPYADQARKQLAKWRNPASE